MPAVLMFWLLCGAQTLVKSASQGEFLIRRASEGRGFVVCVHDRGECAKLSIMLLSTPNAPRWATFKVGDKVIFTMGFPQVRGILIPKKTKSDRLGIPAAHLATVRPSWVRWLGQDLWADVTRFWCHT